LREGSTRCVLGQATSQLIPYGTILMPTYPAHCAPGPLRPSNMPSCPAPHQPVRDPASSKRSPIWPQRPLYGPTSSCLLPWLSSSAQPPLASPLGCPRSLPLSVLHHIRSFPLPPHPPLALETSCWLIISFYLALATLRYSSVALGEIVMIISFVLC